MGGREGWRERERRGKMRRGEKRKGLAVAEQRAGFHPEHYISHLNDGEREIECERVARERNSGSKGSLP